MKLSKNLLQAMTVGLAIGAAASMSSCSEIKEEASIDPKVNVCTDNCDVNCAIVHTHFDDDYCPPCGRG